MLFYIIIFFHIIIISCFFVIFSKNPITSILFLINIFIFVSLSLLFLGAEFLSILLIIIYVGAISILFLFVIMMLNLRIVEVYTSLIKIFPIGCFLGFFLLLEFFFIIKHDFNFFYYDLNEYFEFYFIYYELIKNYNNLYLIGDLLFRYISCLLIISGLILFLAMIGTIFLTLQTSNYLMYNKNNFFYLSNFEKKYNIKFYES